MDTISTTAVFSTQDGGPEAGPQTSPSNGALTVTPRSVGRERGAVRIKLCANVDEEGRFAQWIGSGALQSGFRQELRSEESDVSHGDVAVADEPLRVDGVVSAVLVFEGGPRAGVVDCRLRDHRHTVDLFRPKPGFVIVRMDPSATCDLRAIWDPLELHVICEANRASQGRQCVISAVYTDYPRRRRTPGSVNRLKFNDSSLEWGDNGDALVNWGVCQLSNAQRMALEIICHQWGGLIIFRRGPLVNVADLYAEERCKGLILCESCDIAIGRNTGLGIGEAPMFGAFLDVFNP